MSWFRTDGVIPTAPESAGPVDVPADAERLSALGKARFGSAADQITLSAVASTDDRGNGTPLQRNRMSGGTVGLSYDRLLLGTSIGAKVSFSPNAFEQTFTTVAANRRTETFTSKRSSPAASRLVLSGPRRAARVHDGAVRSDANGRRFYRAAHIVGSAWTCETTRMRCGHGGWSLTDALSVGAGVRQEWRAAPGESAERDGATVGNVTGSWRLSRSIVVRGAASSSHRWPTLNELVRNFQVGAVLTRANPNLLPERAVSADGAGRVRPQLARLGRRILDGRGRRDRERHDSEHAHDRSERRNAGEAHAHGLEMDFDIRPISAVSLRASALVVDSRFRDSLEPGAGRQLASAGAARVRVRERRRPDRALGAGVIRMARRVHPVRR